jgi:hypothetical protein
MKRRSLVQIPRPPLVWTCKKKKKDIFLGLELDLKFDVIHSNYNYYYFFLCSTIIGFLFIHFDPLSYGLVLRKAL